MKTVLDTSFNDLEQFIQEVQHWDLDFRILDTGGFQCRLKQLVSRDVLVSYVRLQRSLDQAGATPPGYRTFGIIGKTCDGFWWRGQQVCRDDLLVFPPSNELRSASHGNFEVFTVSLHSTYLEQLVNDLGIAINPISKHEVIPLGPRVIHELRTLAGMIVNSTNSAASSTISQALAEKLLISTNTGISGKRASLRRRDLAIDRVAEYIRSTPAPVFDSATLCRIARVSERTLQYAFMERYGIPPNVYVRSWNMNTARRLLLQTDPAEATVNEIAVSLGFLHGGQFAADYAKLFSELPSTTLDSKRQNPN